MLREIPSLWHLKRYGLSRLILLAHFCLASHSRLVGAVMVILLPLTGSGRVSISIRNKKNTLKNQYIEENSKTNLDSTHVTLFQIIELEIMNNTFRII